MPQLHQRHCKNFQTLKLSLSKQKKTMLETHNCLQTCNLKLKIVQKTFLNHHKELVTIKGQLSKVQHEN
jgi:hypothetical protein